MSLAQRVSDLATRTASEIKSLRASAYSATNPPPGIVAPVAGVLANHAATAETVIATFSIPAGYLVAGGMLELDMLGQVSSTATLTYRVRIGTAGTTADAQVAIFGATAGAANAHTRVSALIACLTAGTAGTATGGGSAAVASANLGIQSAAFAAAAINTTVALKVTVTLVQSVAQTHTTRVGVLRKVA